MEEKIKVYVSEEIDSILTKDADFFEFYKKDRSLNKNDFLNTLIINYFDSYSHNDNILSEKLQQVFADRLKDDDITDVTSKLLTAVKDYQFSADDSRSDVTISIKPTKKSAGIIDFIQANYLDNVSLSGYFRNMFSSYCLLSQDKRERIIFREKFETISRAINENKMVYFTTAINTERHEASPCAIARSQEELFNYMICVYNSSLFSFRLTRMQNVRILNKPASFTDEQIELMEKMKKAPQYAYNRKVEICVKLTHSGERLFNRIYSYRPKPINVVKDLYYFDRSEQQIYHYFFRFGRSAKVIYPESLKLLMYKDYSAAAKEYAPK